MGQVNVLTTFVLRLSLSGYKATLASLVHKLLWEDGDKATLASLVNKLLWEDGDKTMW